MGDLVEAVKQHAKEHYEDGGWDVIVECWDDEQIASTLTCADVTTTEGAIQYFASITAIYADRQADAEISAF